MLNVFLILIGGLFTGSGFIFSFLWPLSFLGLIPLIHTVGRNAVSAKKAFLLGYLFGIVLCGCAFYAVFWDSIPFTWVLHDIGVSQYLMVGIGWTLTSILCASVIGLWAIAVCVMYSGKWWDVVNIASAWVLVEWFGSVLLSLGVWGDGSLIGSHITINYLGNLLADNLALLQAARWGGVFALSFIVVMTNVIVLRVLYARSIQSLVTRILPLIMLAVVTIIGPSFIPSEPKERDGETVTIAALNTQFPSDLKTVDIKAYYAGIAEVMNSALAARPDIILVPEGIEYLRVQRSTGQNLIPEDAPVHPMIISSETVLHSSTTARRVVEYYDTLSKSSHYTYKQFLVPVGEYMPFAMRIAGAVFGFTDAINEIETWRHFVPGSAPTSLAIKEITIGALFCNEILSPELYRNQALSGAQVFVNLASHNRYHGSEAIRIQIERAARIRAVENQRPLVVAHDTSPSFSLDTYGRTTGMTEIGKAGILISQITPSTTTTPYMRAGSYVLFIPLYLLCVALVSRIRSKKWML